MRDGVGLRDPGKSFDGRPVEADTFLEGALKLGWRDGDRLEETEHVCEPQPDEPDIPFLQRAEHKFLLPIHTRHSMH